MKRRSLLALVGAGAVPLPGCLTAAPGSPDASDCRSPDGLTFDAETEAFVVDPDDDTVETLGFTLRNETGCRVAVAPDAWRIEREDGETNGPVASGDGDGDARTLGRGATHTWSLSVVPHPTPRTETTTYVTADLPDGRYAFVVGATAGDERVTRRARFRLTTSSTA